MSLVAWYRYKADQCGRMAKDATDLLKRADYEEEQKLWLEIARRIVPDEGASPFQDQLLKRRSSQV
jgi:hypothetical protein